MLDSPERLSLVRDALFAIASEMNWHLQAWAILSNHYHFIAVAPTEPTTLRQLIAKLHMRTAKRLNEWDTAPGRKVWHQYWDTRITFPSSLLARLNYVHHNPTHHGVVNDATCYPWCSAGWYRQHVTSAQWNTLRSFKADRLNVPDDF